MPQWQYAEGKRLYLRDRLMVVASSATRRRGGDKIMWYSYVLQSKKNARLYVGVTDDLRRRFKEHDSGQGGKYTKDNGPFKLIFYEAHINKFDAYKSEKFFKSGYGKEVLKDKLENYFKD